MTLARRAYRHRWPAVTLVVLGHGCGPAQPGQLDAPAQPAESGAPGWELVYHEDFEDPAALGTPPAWAPDTYPDDGPFSDHSDYFRAQGIAPPVAYRRSHALGTDGWLTIEAYSRSAETTFADQTAVVPDPGGGANRVLRLRSPEHTDATVVRPTQPLPVRYRVSLRVGHPDFGDGVAGGTNGYDGGERAEPWVDYDATRQNGFYWLTILDAVPRPHNNVWIHHHRKLVVDSDNHFPPWMEIFDGSRFVESGKLPIMMFAVDGSPGAVGHPLWGKPFLSFSAGEWQPSGAIRAVDSYRPGVWYDVTIERDMDRFVIEVRGDFAYGGTRTYHGSIELARHCVWHFNRPNEAAPAACIDETPFDESQSPVAKWPDGQGWPDYFMFGDPHANFYEGQVHYDDIRLEVWRD